MIGSRTRSTYGEIFKNGKPFDISIKSSIGFVTQQDFLFSTQTVRESIKTAADLKISGMSEIDKKKRVDDIIHLLKLENVADNYIGSKISKGLSGGERKRVNIGCEMVNSPDILLLDEPTSGLDASTAYQIGLILRRFASMGHTIICTIHQPRETLFSMFDRLLILSHGETFYFGSGGSAILEYFSARGYSCPSQANPADFVLDVLTGTNIDGVNMLKPPSANIFYNSNSIVGEIRALEEKLLPNGPVKPHSSRTSLYSTGFWYQLKVLSVRSLKNEFRNPLSSFVALGRTLFMALLVGALYFDIGLNAPSAIYDRQGCIFFILINQTFGTLASISLLIEDQEIFSKEKNSNLYRFSAYFISKCIAELPLLVFFSVLFISICYWMVLFNDDAVTFLVFTLIVFLVTYASASYTVLVGAIFRNEKAASTFTSIFLTLFLLFGGNTFITGSSIPVYFKWIEFISFFKYATAASIKVIFTGLSFGCPNIQDQIQVPCLDDPSKTCHTICRIPDGETVLHQLDLDHGSYIFDLLMLIIIALSFRMIALTILLLKYRPVVPINKKPGPKQLSEA